MGRGVGPILVGAFAGSRVTLMVLLIGCLVAIICVTAAWYCGKLEHHEHEVGPARAISEPDIYSIQQRIVENWLGWNGLSEDGERSAKNETTGSREAKLQEKCGDQNEEASQVDGGSKYDEQDNRDPVVTETIAWVFN